MNFNLDKLGPALVRQIVDHCATHLVVVAALHRGRQLLVSRRSSQCQVAPGHYHLPGGHVEYGESPQAALVREIKEEIGLDIEVGQPLGVFSTTYHDNWHLVGIVLWARLLDEAQKMVLDAKETSAAFWCERSEICLVSNNDVNYHHDYDLGMQAFDILERNDDPGRLRQIGFTI